MVPPKVDLGRLEELALTLFPFSIIEAIGKNLENGPLLFQFSNFLANVNLCSHLKRTFPFLH